MAGMGRHGESLGIPEPPQEEHWGCQWVVGEGAQSAGSGDTFKEDSQQREGRHRECVGERRLETGEGTQAE